MTPRPRLLFVTYARLQPTAQIGVLKRVLRLTESLLASCELHLLHFGYLPADDPLVARVLPALQLHAATDMEAPAVAALLQRLQPDVVVFGEAPFGGALRTVHRVARRMEQRQAAIDNYYGEFAHGMFPREWPSIAKWLLLGIDQRQRSPEGDIAVVPPLLAPPAAAAASREGVVILGYDLDTLRTGVALMRRLPSDCRAELYTHERWLKHLPKDSLPRIRLRPLPDDAGLADALARARLVVCKNGFQQMIEALALGAPVIARVCGGGVDEHLLGAHLRRGIRYVSHEQRIGEVLLDAALWLVAPPPMPWSAVPAPASPAAFASSRLLRLLGFA